MRERQNKTAWNNKLFNVIVIVTIASCNYIIKKFQSYNQNTLKYFENTDQPYPNLNPT
jgi:hypothetical protein